MDTSANPPAEIALFPLRTVLFPDGLLPLRIFEVRYLDMIGRCHRQRTPFGVVCLTEGSEVRQRMADDEGRPAAGFAREAFHPVGTLATIEALDKPQPGLMTIVCRGTQRFRLVSSEQMKHGLWTGRAELLPADAPVPVPGDLVRLSTALQRLLRSLADDGATAGLPPPFRGDDCGWIANRWCELLPIALDEKQRLMALDNPLLRLELVADLLDRLASGAEAPGG